MRIIIVLTLLSLYLPLSAQEVITVYYDADWKPVGDKKDAVFYRDITAHYPPNDHFLIKDHFITGELQMEAELSSLEPEVRIGEVNYYFKNGKKSQSLTYSNGKLNGKYFKWFENGAIEEEGVMKDDDQAGEWKYYYANGKLRMSGNYISGSKSGEWKVYNLEGVYYLLQTYKEGNLSAIKLIDKSNGMYQYFSTVDSQNKFSLTPFVDYSTAEEFKLVEPLVKENLKYLQSCTDLNQFYLVYPFTMIYLTSNPTLGKFVVNTTPFMVEYSKVEESYKYSSIMTSMYMLGLGAYFLEHQGQIDDLNKYHESGAKYMINYYLQMKKVDSKEKSKKLEELVELEEKGKLEDFIKKYK
ncbi:MAG: toxin-antitoxin system YwqK family antitoxin [Chitinophagales bacterium]